MGSLCQAAGLSAASGRGSGKSAGNSRVRRPFEGAVRVELARLAADAEHAPLSRRAITVADALVTALQIDGAHERILAVRVVVAHGLGTELAHRCATPGVALRRFDATLTRRAVSARFALRFAEAVLAAHHRAGAVAVQLARTGPATAPAAAAPVRSGLGVVRCGTAARARESETKDIREILRGSATHQGVPLCPPALLPGKLRWMPASMAPLSMPFGSISLASAQTPPAHRCPAMQSRSARHSLRHWRSTAQTSGSGQSVL